MKTYKITIWGETEELIIYRASYAIDGTLAVVAVETNGEPFATLTVKLCDTRESDTKAFLDTNNCPWVEQLLPHYDIAKDTGDFAVSGFCVYPLWEFDLSKLEERK